MKQFSLVWILLHLLLVKLKVKVKSLQLKCIALDARTNCKSVGGESLARLNVLHPIKGSHVSFSLGYVASQVIKKGFLGVVCLLEIFGRFFVCHSCFALLVFVGVVFARELSESDSDLSLCSIWFQTKYFEGLSERGCCAISLAALTGGGDGGGGGEL